MRVINSTALSESLFRFAPVNLLTDSWFLGQLGEARPEARGSSACDEAAALLDAIAGTAGTVYVAEIGVSRKATYERLPARAYSTIYVSSGMDPGLTPQGGADLVRAIRSPDVLAVSVWTKARCVVKDARGDRSVQLLPFIEMVSGEDDAGMVRSLLTSPVTSLWMRDNRAAMLLIWLLADPHLRRVFVRSAARTDWPLLVDALQRAEFDLGKAGRFLSACSVSDADCKMYECCAMVLPDDSATVHENTQLSEANAHLERIWHMLSGPRAS